MFCLINFISAYFSVNIFIGQSPIKEYIYIYLFTICKYIKSRSIMIILNFNLVRLVPVEDELHYDRLASDSSFTLDN